jgi:2-polyprenyl-6-methoxyphenol hydroxylase-like FAD-dependent oxidoreductase
VLRQGCIGGGIGGFATALSLHAAGIECKVFEQSRAIRELDIGINLLPQAVKELAKLGLLEAGRRSIPAMIAHARQLNPRIDFTQTNLVALDVGDSV